MKALYCHERAPHGDGGIEMAINYYTKEIKTEDYFFPISLLMGVPIILKQFQHFRKCAIVFPDGLIYD